MDVVLSQNNIDWLDKLSSSYGCEILLPPVIGHWNVCIYTDNLSKLTPLHEELFYAGYSFVQRMEEGRSFIEITGFANYHGT